MSKSILKNNKIHIIAILVTVICTCCSAGVESSTTQTMAATSIPFSGVAMGGQLIVAEALNRNMRIVVIQTETGESAQSVASRLARYIDENNPFEWGGFRKGTNRITAEGGVVKGLLGSVRYILAGTEMGLGIPIPPISVSCTTDSRSDMLSINWINPPGGYEKIILVYNWTHFDHRGGNTLDGNASSFKIDLLERPMDINDLDIWVIGVKNGLSSNAGAIHVSGNGKIQDEFFGIPFTNSVAPNWHSWTINGETQNKNMESLIKNDFLNTENNRTAQRRLSMNTKPFYQGIKTPPQGGVAGIWRKFLGLIPGHTYKITARLNTLGMDVNDPNWSFSLHAVPTSKGINILTEKQMAGLAVLPNGNSGPQAGRITSYEKGKTSKGEYAADSADITLPLDSDSITVWLRLTAKESSEVAFDWIKLEDLAPGK